MDAAARLKSSSPASSRNEIGCFGASILSWLQVLTWQHVGLVSKCRYTNFHQDQLLSTHHFQVCYYAYWHGCKLAPPCQACAYVAYRIVVLPRCSPAVMRLANVSGSFASLPRASCRSRSASSHSPIFIRHTAKPLWSGACNSNRRHASVDTRQQAICSCWTSPPTDGEHQQAHRTCC